MHKIKPNSSVRSRVDLRSLVRNETVPAGSRGVVLEIFSNPEGYLVEFLVNDENRAGCRCYEVLVLAPEQVEGCANPFGVPL